MNVCGEASKHERVVHGALQKALLTAFAKPFDDIRRARFIRTDFKSGFSDVSPYVQSYLYEYTPFKSRPTRPLSLLMGSL